MSYEFSESHLAAKLREVLKAHQRDGLSVIGNVDKLVTSLVHAVHDWIEDDQAQRKGA